MQADAADVVAARLRNHRFPSGPAVMPVGMLFVVGTGYSVNEPSVVTRPIWLVADSVNHKVPSGPVVMPAGTLFGVGMG